MPSEQQPAGGQGGERFPDMRADIGEDPARWLDRDLFAHGQVRLEDRQEVDFEAGRQRLVRDSDVSAPGTIIRDRIAGIDELAVARAWEAIERRLDRTPDGGRDVVINLLQERIAELEEQGERDLPGHTAEELRTLGAEKYEAIAPKPDVVYRGPDGAPTGRSTGSTASQKLAAIDGGESA